MAYYYGEKRDNATRLHHAVTFRRRVRNKRREDRHRQNRSDDECHDL